MCALYMRSPPPHGLAAASCPCVTATRGADVPRPLCVQASKPKPLSPGSNYPTTSNIQTQKSGFGNFLQKFQKVRAGRRRFSSHRLA